MCLALNRCKVVVVDFILTMSGRGGGGCLKIIQR